MYGIPFLGSQIVYAPREVKLMIGKKLVKDKSFNVIIIGPRQRYINLLWFPYILSLVNQELQVCDTFNSFFTVRALSVIIRLIL